ncbi:MAG: hypothetical protein SFU56_01800 [Capsulimonadales bacterium]|nr:hypothetical protein [Capsulimonadales bacterium]
MLFRREQIRWEQVDPRITARVGSYVARTRSADASAVIRSTEKPVSETSRSITTSSGDRLDPAWTVVSFIGALFIVFLYLNACFNLVGPVATTMLSALPIGLAGIGTMAGMVEQGRGLPTPRLRGNLVPLENEVRQAFLRSGETRAERLYGDVIVQLASAPVAGAGGNPALRQEMLRECNALLADHYRIAVHRQQVARLMEDGALARTEAELLRLQARLDRATDPVARRSYHQSLEICQERLEALRGLDPLLARLEAQEELICQALSLAQAALARVDATPVTLTAPDVEGLRTTVRQVLHRTRAVEEAVLELNDHAG